MTIQLCSGIGVAILCGILTLAGVPSTSQRSERPVDKTVGGPVVTESGTSYPTVGASAPAFDLPDLNGKRIRLEDLRGKNVILNFWAFWCDTWRDEMPHLHELAARQSDLNFRIVAISVDGTRLPEFAPRAASNLPFPVLLDVGGKVTESYQIEHVPTVVLLDANGHVRYSCVAWPGNQAILNHLRKLASARGEEKPSPVSGLAGSVRPRSNVVQRTRSTRR